MSYAGPVSRGKRAQSVTPINSTTVDANGGQRRSKAFRPLPDSGDSDRTMAFAAGIALGIALGAGAALLFAPQSGADARHSIARRGRRIKRRSSTAWDDLRFEMRQLQNQLQRKSLRRRDASSL
jgi:hypothetical protein